MYKCTVGDKGGCETCGYFNHKGGEFCNRCEESPCPSFENGYYTDLCEVCRWIPKKEPLKGGEENLSID